MIAIGGIIGPGLLIGSGGALAAGGPAALLIVFALVGLVALFVMQSVGDLATLYPQGGSFMTWTGRFVDDALSLVVGWNYWLIWVTVLANEYNVSSLLLRYWTTALPGYAWVLLLWFFFGCVALLGVAVYGELEFYLASIKIVGLLVFFVAAIAINTGGIGNQGYIGFRFFDNPGAFAAGFAGVAKVFSFTSTFFAGVEAIGTTAGETRNPRKAIPTAIKQVFFRIIVIYLGTAFFFTLTVPYNASELINAKSRSAASPITIALTRAGWAGSVHLVNAFILVAVISAANSCIYIASRTVLFLANEGKAPRFLARTTRRGVPVNAILFSNFFGLLALINSAEAAGKVYSSLINISSVSTFIVWGIINLSHIRHTAGWKAQGYSRSSMPYQSWYQPYQAYAGLILSTIFTLIQGYSSFAPFNIEDFVVAYIVLPVSVLGYIGWKFWHKTRWLRSHEMDLQSGRILEEDLDAPSLVDGSTQKKKSIWRRMADTVAGNE
ncbi:amino acid permease [Protomyces lactucae-debilis]|uniref:Amino acid permease n=1 Tax=Protomyces lactucae-debilis TaxID=2754530 RepID=A0A1Y2FVE7_PROLT|nr:amino acid permease [Protomyces lactucae-debilis]ORY87962.1 amino acid permease [Protomyces lactucae-debilis]